MDNRLAIGGVLTDSMARRPCVLYVYGIKVQFVYKEALFRSPQLINALENL